MVKIILKNKCLLKQFRSFTYGDFFIYNNDLFIVTGTNEALNISRKSLKLFSYSEMVTPINLEIKEV